MFPLRLSVGVTANVLIIAVPLFAIAGTFDWWRTWVIVGLMFFGTIWSVMNLPRALLEERMKPPVQKGQPPLDRLWIFLLLAALGGLLVVTPLDVFHLHLLSRPPAIVSALGLASFLGGFAIAFLALRENAFAAPVVKHQAERQQSVVATGVYGIVRHPMYAGALLFMVGLALWLESYAGALFAIVAAVALTARIGVEERFLRRELSGYDEYVRRVPYRLLPFVW